MKRIRGYCGIAGVPLSLCAAVLLLALAGTCAWQATGAVLQQFGPTPARAQPKALYALRSRISPPSSGTAWPACHTVAWPLPAVAVTSVGEPGADAGVTWLDGKDAGPVPISLVAVTVNV